MASADSSSARVQRLRWARLIGFASILLGLAINPAAASSAAEAPQPGIAATLLAATVPFGQDAPVAHQLCPKWVHDEYVATGPDGKTYAAWHPPVDPRWLCYFGHEHGTDPAMFMSNYRPLFGYSAAKMGMNEGHAGFKGYGLKDGNGSTWYFLQHQGTSSPSVAACIRYHTLDIAVQDGGGHIVVNIHTIGDFGYAVDNQVYNQSHEAQGYLTPSACPDEVQKAADSNGIRQLPVKTSGGVHYEPWRADISHNILGLTPNGSPTFNDLRPAAMCDDENCRSDIPTGEFGEQRILTLNNNFGIHAGANRGLTGEFQTDPTGTMPCPMPGMTMTCVPQYVQPGFNSTIQTSDNCYPMDALSMPYVCDGRHGRGDQLNFEGSLQSPN